MTTTGSTVMTGLDTMPPSILLWRSTGQWIGGIGIIGLAIVILPFLKVGGMQLFRLESSDRSEKGMARTREIASAVGRVYVVLTLACFMTYWLLGMSAFDALNHALTTLPTAGFSTHDSSFGYFNSPALEWAGTVFMFLGALPFLAYLQFARRGSLWDRIEPQIPTYFVVVSTFIIVFAVWVHVTHDVPVRDGAHQDRVQHHVGGDDHGLCLDRLPAVGRVRRGLVLHAHLRRRLRRLDRGRPEDLPLPGDVPADRAAHPEDDPSARHRAAPLRHAARCPTSRSGRSAPSCSCTSRPSSVIAILLALIGLDTATALSGAATAIGNVGAGVGPIIGPAGNFSTLPDAAKLVLTVAMIMGRLEILSILLLLMPSFYR